jgi:hypothetical protein
VAFVGDPKRGGAGSIQVLASDKSRYNIKFKENSQGLRVLVNELVASQIALRLGVPTPETVLMEVTTPFLQANTFLERRYAHSVSTGKHFGSRLLRNMFDNPPTSLIAGARNRIDFPAVIVFDVLTNNSDRANAQNFLMVRPDQYPRTLDFVAIDFGHCFGSPSWDVSITSRVGQWCGSCFPEMAGCIEGAEPFREALERLSLITTAWIGDLLDSVPSEWSLTPPEREALSRFILGQRGEVARILTANRNRFSKWK